MRDVAVYCTHIGVGLCGSRAGRRGRGPRCVVRGVAVQRPVLHRGRGGVLLHQTAAGHTCAETTLLD